MPALSPTMEEGTLSSWNVKEGDEVKSGDIIAEIETDKATMEVEAVDEGRVGKILVAEGTEGVKVNQVIALLLEEDEDDSIMVDEILQEGEAVELESGSDTHGYREMSLQELHKELDNAVASEDYEKAAKLRDEISKRK